MFRNWILVGSLKRKKIEFIFFSYTAQQFSEILMFFLQFHVHGFLNPKPQFNCLIQNHSIEHIFVKWNGKVTSKFPYNFWKNVFIFFSGQNIIFRICMNRCKKRGAPPLRIITLGTRPKCNNSGILSFLFFHRALIMEILHNKKW